MVWRPSYRTRELRPTPVPRLTGISLSGEPYLPRDPQLIVGGFDLRSQAELGVWRRLLSEVSVATPLWTFYFGEFTSSSMQKLTPRSLWDRTIVSSDAAEWKAIVEPDRPDRSFGCHIIDSIVDPLMVGLPTEEALDRFVSRLRLL